MGRACATTARVVCRLCEELVCRPRGHRFVLPSTAAATAHSAHVAASHSCEVSTWARPCSCLARSWCRSRHASHASHASRAVSSRSRIISNHHSPGSRRLALGGGERAAPRHVVALLHCPPRLQPRTACRRRPRAPALARVSHLQEPCLRELGRRRNVHRQWTQLRRGAVAGAPRDLGHRTHDPQPRHRQDRRRRRRRRWQRRWLPHHWRPIQAGWGGALRPSLRQRGAMLPLQGCVAPLQWAVDGPWPLVALHGARHGAHLDGCWWGGAC